MVYLDMNELIPSEQSDFRRNRLHGDLLLYLLSDFYDAMDHGQITLLALFDVSSAFGSVDHPILQRLSILCWLGDQPLEWLSSFLSERTNCAVGSSSSLWVPAPFWLGLRPPALFSLHT